MIKQIIIIGGMGPQASIKLHENIVAASRRFHNGAPDAYPAILHSSVQVPDFIESTATYRDALKVLTAACRSLPLAQASAIGIACNTAHLMVPALPLASTPFVSMIEAVADALAALPIERVGLLASPHTVRTGLYHEVLQRKNLEIIAPRKRELDRLGAIIHGVISGVSSTELRPQLSALSQTLQDRGAQAILLGCTELPLVGVDSQLPVVDSLQVLANAMLEKHYAESCIL